MTLMRINGGVKHLGAEAGRTLVLKLLRQGVLFDYRWGHQDRCVQALYLFSDGLSMSEQQGTRQSLVLSVGLIKRLVGIGGDPRCAE